MFDSVRPRRWQPTRLPCPWDSPGKNTGVGCHFLLQCMKVKSQSEVAQSCLTPSNPMDCSLPGSSVHGIFQARVLEWGAITFSNNTIQSSKYYWSFMSHKLLMWSHFEIGIFLVMSGFIFLTKRVDTLVYTPANKFLIPKHQPKPQLKSGDYLHKYSSLK